MQQLRFGHLFLLTTKKVSIRTLWGEIELRVQLLDRRGLGCPEQGIALELALGCFEANNLDKAEQMLQSMRIRQGADIWPWVKTLGHNGEHPMLTLKIDIAP